MISQEEINTAQGLHSTETGYLPGAVLLAEDDPALRRYLEVVMQRAGYRVLSAGDGLEAMKLLLGSKIDAVVTDAMMPNLNGYELCRFVRTTKHLAHLPIILLSALDPKNATSEAEQANAFLCKPVSPESLLECLVALGVEAAQFKSDP
jgi:CheY-like chemotaxis protein